ncbi:protein FAM110D [Lissotriton helveticus]
MLRPVPLAGSSSPLGLLNRGPEYLRRQLDGGSRARSPSAVERLEADKAKYVKTQQVIDSRQDPALATTPSCTRKLLSVWSEPGAHCATSPSKATSSRLGAVVRRSSGRRQMRPDSLVMYRQQRDCKSVNKENARGLSLVRRLFQSPMRERRSDTLVDPSSQSTPINWILMDGARASSPIASCGSPRAQRVAPPFLKVDFPSPQSPALTPRFTNSEHYCVLGCGDRGRSHSSLPSKHLPPQPEALEGSRCVNPQERPLSPSEEDHFFYACGMDEPDLLRKENMSPLLEQDEASSISSWESKRSAHSRNSALEETSSEEEGPLGRTRTPVSIIERNARVIRWLYSCQKSQSTRQKSTKEESPKNEYIRPESTKRESTV